jgi:translation initiation factor IF-1
MRSIQKNAIASDDYLSNIMSADSLSDLKDLIRDSQVLGRVTRNVGGGRLQVLLQTGEEESIRIAGNLRFHGKSANKTDRSNCMIQGDIILVDAGQASAKLTGLQVDRVRRVFSKLGMSVPGGFFSHGDEEVDDAFDWDRSEEEAEEEARRAAETRKAMTKGGGSVRSRATVLNPLEEMAAVSAAEAAVSAELSEEEEEVATAPEDDGPEDGKRVRPLGPNRAQRRAALAAEKAAAEAAAEEAALAAKFSVEPENYKRLADRTNDCWDLDIDAI